ncbi:uncharacterized protein LOC115674363 [Syzygium oleosum]|uniref:uncharacterized protein LOC115674363 n=1 Tax=Syzygium oleosum TaxID=219896 RepID=UPI0024BBD593|nr:uncharacterized protein LOC115674363 [Syzygium oleosum]
MLHGKASSGLPLAMALQLFLAPTLFLLSSSAFAASSHGDSLSRPFEAPSPSGWDWESKAKLLGTTGREYVIGPSTDLFENSISALAAERTYRRDPLDGFKRYTGGWNLKDHHYWGSVGFTAAPWLVIAAMWFLGFGVCLLVMVCCSCSRKQPDGQKSSAAYPLSLIFLVVFSIASIIGCIVIYTGQGKFHKTTSRALEYVVNQADLTVGKLKDVSDNIAQAKQVGVDKVFVPPSVQTDIDQIEAKIDSSTNALAGQTVENSDDMRHLLDSVRLALILTSAVMLSLTLTGLLLSVIRMQFLVYILVIVGWLLVSGSFILSGTFLVLHNVAGDTCVAMDEWIQYPSAHTALDEILPCMDDVTVQETRQRSKEVTYQLAEVVNQVITNVSNLNFSPNFPTMYLNQSGPPVPILCNPFHSDLTDRACSSGEVDLNNAREVWRGFVCQASATGICMTTGRLTPSFYDQMSAAVNVSYGLYYDAPSLTDLQDCTFVRQTFSEVHAKYCPGLQQYSKWVYVGLVMVSVSVMLSLILCLLFRREHDGYVYTKEFEEHKHSQ